ncbi:NAD-dependent epimerase/dehydratase family protein [Streptomyces sp. NPDC056387]|uniref:NAD-dependent epimerase/dehydratase family protein n=1 Tax=Streptomyces sp. NPDC056387 TaxID=3345803 RepID=UPI0035D97194
MQRICVIGGSRYFGKLLVERLHAAGHQVTVINRGSTRPPAGVEHLTVDRNDEAALTAALGSRTFDVVVDQICYTPVQAAIAARAFAGRTRRYVMTSTIEVYDPATAALPAVPPGTPVPEETVDPAAWTVDLGLPWDDDAYLEAHYAEGKRQAEAVLSHAAGFEFASVRSAHVLGGGAREFTGRLAHYVERIARSEEIAVHAKALPTVFVHYEELVDLLLWAAAAEFTGPLNACSEGLLDVYELTAVIGASLGREPVHRSVPAGAEASPFSFDRHYAMSNARATRLGFAFSRTSDWLPGAVAEAVAEVGAEAVAEAGAESAIEAVTA